MRFPSGMLSPRSALVLGFDLAAVAVAWLAAFWMRFNFDVPDDYRDLAWRSLVWVLPVYGVVFLGFGLYRGLWQFASLPDLVRIGKGVAAGGAATALAAYLLQLALVVPRSVVLFSPLIALLVMGGARAAYRAWKEQSVSRNLFARRKPVLVLGAGPAGASLLRELAQSTDWQAMGVLDDDQAKLGLEIHGRKVLGPLDEIDRWRRNLGVAHAIIAMPEATPAERRRAATLCLRAGLAGLTLPAMTDLIDGKVSLSQARRLDVEDLLGREPVRIDDVDVGRLIAGQVVLVTGAGGSIGSELCRQVARFKPARLVLFELSEFALYRMQEEFADFFPDIAVLALVGDVKDEARVRAVLAQTQPALVLHAAAFKHVPLMEEHNAWQAVLNNALGTLTMASAAAAAGVARFVLVSTDKAVNPTNVMGATKRLAEMICQAVQLDAPGTQMITVRFGNVLGSAGSVIPKFQQQVERGGPVTVTHPDVTRYFMSIPEAALLVLQAASMGGAGRIFVLDMGEPIRILELARNVIRLSGRSETEIAIEFTGLRPGEKLYEEVVDDAETLQPTPHPKLRIALARDVVPGWLAGFLAAIVGTDPSPAAAREFLRAWVPEYRPAGSGAAAEAVRSAEVAGGGPSVAAVLDRSA
jgi:FlaA1/EpsC-like NDP-sugar epimerase